ncbi:MAG: hypothetical protein E6G02_12505 [Actinobacteria bacterium]|nr:MAG: hypothetical protein E6G02_12505 [Actinomycetota bacterium]
MRRRGRAVLAAAVAAGTAVTAAHALGRVPAWSSNAGPKRFSISGHVDGLLPGRRLPLVLRIRNPWSRRIRVTSVGARIAASGRPCPPRNVKIDRFRGSLAVGPRSTRTLVVNASLGAGAPAACEGATFALTFFGTAVRH